MVTLPLRILVVGTVMLAFVLATFVVLTVSGYGKEAATLPLFLGTVVPLFFRQEHLSRQIAEHTVKVDGALNGGMHAAVERTVAGVITRMAAQDEAGGTSTVAKAARAITGTDVPAPPKDDKA